MYAYINIDFFFRVDSASLAQLLLPEHFNLHAYNKIPLARRVVRRIFFSLLCNDS